MVNWHAEQLVVTDGCSFGANTLSFLVHARFRPTPPLSADLYLPVLSFSSTEGSECLWAACFNLIDRGTIVADG